MSEQNQPLILVVDDYQDAREMYAEYLQFSGFRVAEAKNLTFRLDAQNVLNHPTPVLPNGSLNINSGTFGEVNNKIGNRALQAQLRFDF